MAGDSADVTVIVPVYRRPRTVLETLASVAAQSAPPARLLVADDGSDDDTVAAIEGWLRERPPGFPVEVLRLRHQGAPAARNRALEAAAGATFLAFLDSDDLWPPDFLARTRAALDAEPSAVAVSTDQVFVGEDGDVSGPRVDLRDLGRNATRWLFEEAGGIASASLLRAAPVRALGGFPEHLPTSHDVDLFLRLSLLGPWRHAPGEPVRMRHGVAHRRGEQANLSVQYEDRHRMRADILERVYVDEGDAMPVPRRVVRRVLARRWRRAGARLLRQGRVEEGRACLRRSCRWQPWGRSWLRLAASYLRRPGSPGA